MNLSSRLLPYLKSFAVTLAMLGFVTVARAHPYASGVSNNANIIYFTLNESADNVTVVYDSGGVGNTNSLGALSAGPQSFPLSGHTSYSIIVSKLGTGAPSQISITNGFNIFPTPRGVAVNMNPQTKYFGRIYVVNSTPGTALGSRPVGRGMYMLNADMSDAIGKGNLPSTGTVAYAVSASSPWKVGVGSNDVVYVNDFASATAMTWAYNPDVTAQTQVLDTIGLGNLTVHGDPAGTPVTRGSIAGGNLVLWNTDGSVVPWNSVVRYDIGSGPTPWNTAPSILANAGIPSVTGLTTDLDVSKDGKVIYTSINRSAGTDVPSIKMFMTNEVTLTWDLVWDSMTIGGLPDPLRQARTIMISPDGKYLAAVHDDNHFSVIPLITYQGTNGWPDFANMTTIPCVDTTTLGRDMAWDAADNLYAVSSGTSILRVYSLGLTTTAVTSNDVTTVNGSFQLIVPATTVSVSNNGSFTSETGPTTGTFTIFRTGDTSGALTVNFTNTGTATFGADYISSKTNTVVLAPGDISTNITITVVDDTQSELTETVILTIKGGGAYSAVAPNPATLTIEDNDPQVINLTGTTANSMYERITNDYATFTLTRYGDTNNNGNSYDVDQYTYTGPAVANVDYVPFTSAVTFAPGDISHDFNVSPLDNSVYYGSNRTVTVKAANGTGYSGGASNGTATIIDDENPPATVLFADSLNANTSAAWKTNFYANNLIDDYQTQWATNLIDFGVSNAPNGSATGLRLTVNKDEPTANGAGGVNLYPLGQSFSGSYALRFNMCLIQHDGASTTEFAAFGINHSGTKSNWFLFSGDLVNNTPKDSDGVWYGIGADGSGSSPADFVQYVGNGAANPPLLVRSANAGSFTTAFKRPPYSPSGIAGSPASITASNSIWSDVEVRQLGNVVTLSINKTAIFVYTNTTAFQSGDIMLGYCDPYASIGIPSGAVYYSNVRVMDLNTVITSYNRSGSTLSIAFTDASDDAAAKFQLRGSVSNVFGTYTNMSATITKTGVGTYSTTTPAPASSAQKYFRIQHLP